MPVIIAEHVVISVTKLVYFGTYFSFWNIIGSSVFHNALCEGSFCLPVCIYRGQCPSYFTVGWSQLSGTVFPIVFYIFMFTFCCICVTFLCCVCVCVISEEISAFLLWHFSAGQHGFTLWTDKCLKSFQFHYQWSPGEMCTRIFAFSGCAIFYIYYLFFFKLFSFQSVSLKGAFTPIEPCVESESEWNWFFWFVCYSVGVDVLFIFVKQIKTNNRCLRGV